ncbi:MAG TPA: sigma-70 family RNA polymerase sigma factor [Dehalococcoidales bacterium]
MIFLILPGGSDTATDTSPGSIAEIFGRLYEQYLPKVYQYVSYRVGNRTEAEELTSVIFEKALTKFGSYDSKRAAFSTWIFSIAHNTVIDHYRGRSREQKLQKEVKLRIVAISTSPEEEAVRSEEIQKLHKCLSLLNRNEQELISLKFSGEMTNREIARITGLSESNVGTILCRAVRKLRDEFSGWQHD